VAVPKRSELGPPITRYTLQTLSWRDLLRAFFPFVLVVMAPVVYGLWRTLYGYSQFGPAAAFYWGRDWFFVGGFLVIPLLLYSLNRLKRAHTWIEVYSWGLYFHFPPSRKRLLRWEDIRGITSYSINKSFLHVYNKTRHFLIVHSLRYPALLCHPDLPGREGLKKTIKKHVYSRIRPRLLQLFKIGEIIPFGDVSISKQKLYLPKQELPWEFIEGITVQKGVFIIKLTTQKRIEIPIRRVQNLEILINLIKTEI
jgi:hypothetical protein